MANQAVRKDPSSPDERQLRGRPPKLPEHVRRAVVLDAAVTRFAEVGATHATVDEIAAACGVRKPSIYELFGTKDELYRAAVEYELNSLADFFRVTNAETAELPMRERTRRRLDAALARAEAHPHGFQLLAQVRRSSASPGSTGAAMRDRLVQVMADNYRRESNVAGTPLDAGADLLAHLFFSMADQVIAMRLANDRWDRSVLVEFLTSFIEGGVSAIEPATWAAIERRGPTSTNDTSSTPR